MSKLATWFWSLATANLILRSGLWQLHCQTLGNGLFSLFQFSSLQVVSYSTGGYFNEHLDPNLVSLGKVQLFFSRRQKWTIWYLILYTIKSQLLYLHLLTIHFWTILITSVWLVFIYLFFLFRKLISTYGRRQRSLRNIYSLMVNSKDIGSQHGCYMYVVLEKGGMV